MKVGQQMTNIIRPVIRLGGYVAGVVLAAMMLLTVLDVFLRFVFNRPILGGMEITEYMMGVLSFLAISYCATEGRHVKVDLLVSRLKDKGQAIFAIIGCALSLMLFIPMTLVYIPEAIAVRYYGEQSEVLGIPAFPFYVVVIIGCGLLSIVLIVELVKSIERLTEK